MLTFSSPVSTFLTLKRRLFARRRSYAPTTTAAVRLHLPQHSILRISAHRRAEPSRTLRAGEEEGDERVRRASVGEPLNGLDDVASLAPDEIVSTRHKRAVLILLFLLLPSEFHHDHRPH